MTLKIIVLNFLFLKKKRYEILDEVHQKQKKIDHLDYLIYTLKNIQNKA